MLDGVRMILEAIPVAWFFNERIWPLAETVFHDQASLQILVFRKDYSYATAVANQLLS